MNKPTVILLIGHPLTGKSTWIKNNHPTTKVISRDDIVLEVFGNDDYNAAFDLVDQKEVDRILTQRLLDSGLQSEDVIIDMTHMTSKRRKANLRYFNDFYKVAIVFSNLSDEEISRRNDKRLLEEKKSIPFGVVKNMIQSFQPVSDDEGFDDVIFL